MDGREPLDCTRCGRTLQRAYRFCPECGLPSSGDPVLSSEISQMRSDLESRRRVSARPPWQRYLLPTSSAVMLTVVLSVGLILFNRRLVETLFPPAPADPDTIVEIAPPWEPQWVAIGPGLYHTGPPFDLVESEIEASLANTAAESVRMHRITNGMWLQFLLEKEEELRASGLWKSIVPRYQFGWRRDPPLTGRPSLPVDPNTGEPLTEALVEDVDEAEVRLYWRWFTSSAAYQINRLGVTNLRWQAFLANGAEGWSDERRNAALPAPEAGWGLEPDGLPGLPRIRVPGATGEPVEVWDHMGVVPDAAEPVLERFRAWVRDAADHPARISNAHWRAFLVLDEEVLRATPVGDGSLWDAALPPAESGWMTDELGLPVIPPRVELGPDARPADVPDASGTVAVSDEAALERFRVWALAALDAAPTNEHWRAFLLSERAVLAAEHLWDDALPGPESGWGLTADGVPTVPCHAEIAVVPGAEMAHWLRVPDELGLVRGVTVDAVREFHAWSSLREIPYAFEISRYEIRNALWRAFLEAHATALAAAGVWSEAVPGTKGGWVRDADGNPAPPAGDLDKPVRNVSPRAVREFARWLTARLGEPGVEIRMPRPAEWEYAARGDGWRIYPWGDRFLGEPAEGTGDPKVRTGLDENHALQVDAVDEDVTEGTGIVALGVNVSEWVEEFDDTDDGSGTWVRRYIVSEVRGASFGSSPEQARTYARVWARRPFEDRVQRPLTGVRLVKWRPGGQ